MTDDALDGSPADARSEGVSDASDQSGATDDPDVTAESGVYEAVRPYPAGATTTDRFALTAAEWGYDGLVVWVDAGESATSLASIREERGIDLADGIEIDAADPSSASGAVGNYRPDCTVLAVRGGSPELARFAVEQPKVDVLTAPFADAGDVNHVICKRARANDVRIEVNLAPVLRAAGGERVRAIQKLRKLRELLESYETPFVVSVRADSHRALRAPREVAAVGAQIGFDRETVREGLREWGRIVTQNRRRRSESFISPGLREGRYEEDDR